MPINKYTNPTAAYDKSTKKVLFSDNASGLYEVDTMSNVIANHVSTPAQALAGTDDTTIMTPLKVKQAISAGGSGATTNTVAYDTTTGVLTSTVNGVVANTTIPASNNRIDKIIPTEASGNFVVNPAVDAPSSINPDGRAIWRKTYNGNFTGSIAPTALATDEAYLVNVTNHYRITSSGSTPGITRTRVDFLAGGLNPINQTYDSQDSTDMVASPTISLNTDQTVSKWYYGTSTLSYFQQEIELYIPDANKTTYPTITIEEQKMEIIIYIVKKNTIITSPTTLY